jgi:hypothetical protein
MHYFCLSFCAFQISKASALFGLYGSLFFPCHVNQVTIALQHLLISFQNTFPKFQRKKNPAEAAEENLKTF